MKFVVGSRSQAYVVCMSVFRHVIANVAVWIYFLIWVRDTKTGILAFFVVREYPVRKSPHKRA